MASTVLKPSIDLLAPLSARWTVEKHDNLDQFLEANGMNWVKRKMAATFMSSGLHLTFAFSENKDSTDSPIQVNMKLKSRVFERERIHSLPCKDVPIEILFGGPDEAKQVQITARLLSAKEEQSAKENDLQDIVNDVGGNGIVLVQFWTSPESTLRTRAYINKEGKLIQDYHKDKAWMRRTFHKD